MVFRLIQLFVVGLAFDYIGIYYKLIETIPATENNWMPLWLISLWLLFISSLPLLITPLQNLFLKKYFIASILGALFGPLSYSAGAQFAVLKFNGTTAIIIYSLFWALYMPLAVFWLKPMGKSKL